MTTKHTPTPFKICNGSYEIWIDRKDENNQRHILCMLPYKLSEVETPTNYDTVQKDAAFIVRAVNSHDALVDELTRNRQQLIELRDNHLNHTAAVVRAIVQKRIEAADAVLLAAKGGAE